MTNRADPRYLTRLRIKVKGTDRWGNRFMQTAFTHNISASGARITDVPPLLDPHAVIEVEYHGRKSRFRVVWVGGLANNEVGLRSLEPSRCIWGTTVPGRLIPCVFPAATALLQPTIASAPLVMARNTISSDPTEQSEIEKKQKRVGYFCKDSDCRKTHAFHFIADGRVVWDIWPQKIECPVSGQRYEYWKRDIRSAGYI